MVRDSTIVTLSAIFRQTVAAAAAATRPIDIKPPFFLATGCWIRAGSIQRRREPVYATLYICRMIVYILFVRERGKRSRKQRSTATAPATGHRASSI